MLIPVRGSLKKRHWRKRLKTVSSLRNPCDISPPTASVICVGTISDNGTVPIRDHVACIESKREKSTVSIFYQKAPVSDESVSWHRSSCAD